RRPFDIALAEVFGRAVRAVNHAKSAHAIERRRVGEYRARACIGERIEVQHVARANRAAAMSAELTEREGAAAAEIVGDIEAAAHAQISARAPAADRAECQRRA